MKIYAKWLFVPVRLPVTMVRQPTATRVLHQNCKHTISTNQWLYAGVPTIWHTQKARETEKEVRKMYNIVIITNDTKVAINNFHFNSWYKKIFNDGDSRTKRDCLFHNWGPVYIIVFSLDLFLHIRFCDGISILFKRLNGCPSTHIGVWVTLRTGGKLTDDYCGTRSKIVGLCVVSSLR